MYTYAYGMCMNDPNIGERVHTWGCFRQYSRRGVRWYRWYVKRTTDFTWVYGGALLNKGYAFDYATTVHTKSIYSSSLSFLDITSALQYYLE